ANGRHKILNGVHHIINQLTWPFDLQRFNELVDAEKWDEDAATFMAMRQTILTQLVSPGHQTLDSIIKSEQEVVADLSDALLSATGLDEVLMDIVLSIFLDRNKGKSSLIVVNNVQDFLHDQSIFSQSLISLAHQDTFRKTGVVLSTTDPTTIPSTIFGSLSFSFCGYSWSPLWRRTLNDHLDFSFDLSTLERGEVLLICPSSRDFQVLPRTKRPISETPAHILIKVEDLSKSTPHIMSRRISTVPQPEAQPPPSKAMTNGDEVQHLPRREDTTLNKHNVVSFSRDTPTNLKPLLNVVTELCGGIPDLPIKYGRVKGLVDAKKDPQAMSWPSFSLMVQAACKEGLIEHTRINGGDFIKLKPLIPEPALVHKSPEERKAPHSATSSLGSSPPPLEPVSARLSPKADASYPKTFRAQDYPREFHSLMRILISRTKGYLGTALEYPELMEDVIKDPEYKNSRWSSFGELIRAAANRGYIDDIILPGAGHFVSLKEEEKIEDDRLKPFEGPTRAPDRSITEYRGDTRANRAGSGSPSNNGTRSGSTGLWKGHIPDVSTSRVPSPAHQRAGSIGGIPRKTTISTGITVDTYPGKYHSLIGAIVALSTGQAHVRVNYETVRKLVATKVDIERLGWKNFFTWVATAQKDGLIYTGGTGDTRWIALYPKEMAVESTLDSPMGW
ncbi:hypothetical protein FS842_011395, partial [Serendipita sp. 407]